MARSTVGFLMDGPPRVLSKAKRETAATVFDQGQDRRVMVEVNPMDGTISVRLKSTRRTFHIGADRLYWALAKGVL